MTIGYPASAAILATILLLGCEGGTTTVPPAPFELQGKWLYLGPWDGGYTLTVSNESMVYADVDGAWSSDWALKTYDNGLHHFQMVLKSGIGAYSPTGPNLSGAYELGGSILTVQLADGLDSYPSLQSPGSCTEGGSNPIPNCALFMNQM